MASLGASLAKAADSRCLIQKCLSVAVFSSSSQTGAEGRADPSVPDFPSRPSAALDPGGGLATQDATRLQLPDEERPDLHASERSHRKGAQTARGGCMRHFSIKSVWSDYP